MAAATQGSETPTDRLYVGNLSWSVSDDSLRQEFINRGFSPVDSKVVTDRETGRSRGFGFVSFATVEEATAAQAAANSQDFGGRNVRVSFAQARGTGGSGGYQGAQGASGGFSSGQSGSGYGGRGGSGYRGSGRGGYHSGGRGGYSQSNRGYGGEAGGEQQQQQQQQQAPQQGRTDGY